MLTCLSETGLGDPEATQGIELVWVRPRPPHTSIRSLLVGEPAEPRHIPGVGQCGSVGTELRLSQPTPESSEDPDPSTRPSSPKVCLVK